MTKPAPLLAAALLAGLSGPALAGRPGADWMPMDQVVRKLGEAGYSEIRSLKADDGRWKGKAVRDGRPVSVTVDPRTGAVAETIKEKHARETGRGGGKGGGEGGGKGGDADD